MYRDALYGDGKLLSIAGGVAVVGVGVGRCCSVVVGGGGVVVVGVVSRGGGVVSRGGGLLVGGINYLFRFLFRLTKGSYYYPIFQM